MNVKFRDGTTNKISVFASAKDDAPTFVCLPAMGVKARYYEGFAQNLSSRGYNVVTADWRGLGKSSVRASRTADFGYQELIDDLKEVLDAIEKQFPDTKKILIGHSLGGQIGSLFSCRWPAKVAGMILITSGSAFYKGWKGPDKLKVKLAGELFYPIAKCVGYFPGKLVGFGGMEAKTVMKNWCHNVLTGRYEGIDPSFDYEKALKKLNLPVLSISIENDFLASKQAAINLIEKFDPKVNATYLEVNDKNSGISNLNHFNWAKNPDYFVKIIEGWVNNKISSHR